MQHSSYADVQLALFLPDSFVDRETALNDNLAYVTDTGTVIMSGDNTSWVPVGQNRNRCIIVNIISYGSFFLIHTYTLTIVSVYKAIRRTRVVCLF